MRKPFQWHGVGNRLEDELSLGREGYRASLRGGERGKEGRVENVSGVEELELGMKTGLEL